MNLADKWAHVPLHPAELADQDKPTTLQSVPAHQDGPRRRITLIPASSVRTERLDWLIDNWVPRRSMTLLAGREGLGKSTIACDIAAQASRGELDGKPMNVAYLNTEDSRSITVAPRLQAAGADMDRVFFFDVTTETGSAGGLQLPGDTSILAQALASEDVGLVILDAAKSAMHSSLDGYRDDDVRQFLEPLSAMCDEHDMSIIGLVHFGKRESNDPGKLILGSVAWSQIARSVLSVAVDDEGTLVVTNTKGNLAPAQVSREARIESVTIPTDDGKTTDVGRVVWGDNTNVSAADLLVSRDDPGDDRSEAEMIVVDYLISQGGSASAGDIRKQIMAAGLTWKTVQNNRRKWGVKTEQRADGWVWSLEADPEDTSRTRESRDLGSEQVKGYISGPDGGQVPHPTCTGTSRDLTDPMPRAAVMEALAPHPQTLDQIKKQVTLTYREDAPNIISMLIAEGTVTDHADGTYSLD